MNEEEKQAIETMKHWIEYEKSNKDKINKADELIEIQETVLNLLERKDKEIQFQKEINKTEQDRHKQTEKSLKGQLKKKDKIINLMEDEINKILKDTFERFGLSAYLEKENITVRKFIERKLENGNWSRRICENK